MFRFVALFTFILACNKSTLGSNIHGASLGPASSIVLGQYGHGALANAIVSRNLAIPAASIISSYSSSVVHPNSAVLRPNVASYIPRTAHQQYISALLPQQIYSSPLVSNGIYGQNGLRSNSNTVQRSYTAPLAAVSGYSARGIYSPSILARGHGSNLVQSLGGISAHRSVW